MNVINKINKMKILLYFVVLFALTWCKKDDDDKKGDGNSHDDILTVNQKMFEKAAKKTSGFSSNNKLIKEEDMLEGDIVLNPQLKEFLNNQRSGKEITAFDAAVRKAWPNARVPYTFARGFRYTSVVRQAIAEYKAKTCISFEQKTSRDRSYVEFMHGGGCYSMIGRVGGRQQISLGNGCGTVGVAIHEMMHALGFFHEQSRRDRDSYIRIMWNNIPGRVRYNFEKYRHGAADTLGEKYDKKSVMHYGNYAFSTNRQKTIVSISNPNEVLGQRRGLSVIDIRQLKKMYKCGGVTPVVTPRPPTTGDCKDSYSLCSTLASVGYCRITSISWMKNNCKKSCKNCPTRPSLPRCTTTPKHCVSWKGKGFCTDPRYKKWMEENCYQCNKCRR